MPADAGSDGAATRRTDPVTLAAVVDEVARMVDEGVKGSAGMLAERLAGRGVVVAVSTLRAGECRPHLERVWVRRLPSMRSFGPTGGHDLRPVDELVDHVIDLKCRIGRVEADLQGLPYDRGGDVERDVRSHAACRAHDEHKRGMAARIEALIPVMAAAGTVPTYDSVSEALGRAGHPLSARRIRSRDEYSRPILRFHGVEPPMKPFDPERDRLSRLTAEELGAMVFALLAELRIKEAEFEATLVD